MKNITTSAVLLIIATIIAKILGFGRELVLASAYGTSMYSDAYITAMNIPTIIFTSVGAAIGTTFIPMYFEAGQNLEKDKSLDFTNNILNIVVIICFIISILGMIFTESIVKVSAIGFKGEIFELCVKFTKVFMIGTVFTGLSYIMTAYLQAKNEFVVPGLMTLPRNIIIIISIVMSIKYGIKVMVWGSLVGIISEYIFQLPFAIKNNYRYKLKVDIKDRYIQKTIYLLGPILLGVAVNQVNSIVDKSLASTLVEGSISALNYANKLNGFVMALFITSITTVIYPSLSKLSSDKNNENFINTISKSINSIIILVVPISIGAMVLANPIIKILFERGEFDSKATSMTAISLIMYSIGMLSFGLRDILGKVFYSLKDTKTPMVNGIIAMSMNIVLNLFFIKYLKYAGLALATSLSGIICIVLLFHSLKKKIGYYGQDKIIKTMTKSIIASVGMGLIVYFGYNILINMLGKSIVNEFITLLISISIGVLVYIILIALFKIEEVSNLIEAARDKLNSKFNNSLYKN